ncbi:MAG: hypothetical protein ACOYOA_08285 [Saprospiraceae bacterium]
MNFNFKYIPFIILIAFLSSCAKKNSPVTIATLKPIARIKLVDKSQFPEIIRYTLSYYSDQRLELTGNSGMDKIGNYTTMLSAKDNEAFNAMLKKFKRGHFTYNDSKQQLSYDVLYFPLKKEISMGDAIQLPMTPYMGLFITQVEDFIAYKNWYKKDLAPKLLSEKDAGNMMVTLKSGVKPAVVINNPKFADMKLKTVSVCDEKNNTWLFGFLPGMKTADAVYRIKSDPAVLGAIPNTIINLDENLKIYSKVEIIVQFKENIGIQDWIKTYVANDMKVIEKVAPDLNYWLLSFDDSTIAAKELITKIKSDPRVAEVQMNKKVGSRE